MCGQPQRSASKALQLQSSMHDSALRFLLVLPNQFAHSHKRQRMPAQAHPLMNPKREATWSLRIVVATRRHIPHIRMAPAHRQHTPAVNSTTHVSTALQAPSPQCSMAPKGPDAATTINPMRIRTLRRKVHGLAASPGQNGCPGPACCHAWRTWCSRPCHAWTPCNGCVQHQPCPKASSRKPANRAAPCGL